MSCCFFLLSVFFVRFFCLFVFSSFFITAVFSNVKSAYITLAAARCSGILHCKKQFFEKTIRYFFVICSVNSFCFLKIIKGFLDEVFNICHYYLMLLFDVWCLMVDYWNLLITLAVVSCVKVFLRLLDLLLLLRFVLHFFVFSNVNSDNCVRQFSNNMFLLLNSYWFFVEIVLKVCLFCLHFRYRNLCVGFIIISALRILPTF